MKRSFLCALSVMLATGLFSGINAFGDATEISPADGGAKITWSHGDVSDPKDVGGVTALWVGYAGAGTMRCTGVLVYKLPEVADPSQITGASFGSVLRLEDRVVDISNQLVVIGVRDAAEVKKGDYSASGTMIDKEFVKSGTKVEKGWLPVKTSEEASQKLLETIRSLYKDQKASGKYLVIALRSEKYNAPTADKDEARRMYDVELSKLELTINK